MLLTYLERSEKANVLDNSHTRGNLHRTRNQRLPAGRVLIQTHPIEIARRARKPGGLFACQACRQGARRLDSNCGGCRGRRHFPNTVRSPTRCSRNGVMIMFLVALAGDSTVRCGRHEPMSGLTTNEIAAFVTLALLLALVLIFLLR